MTDTDQLTAYAYVLTLQFALGGMDHYVAESRGVVELPDGYSRNRAFQELRQSMISQAREQGLHTFRGEPTTVFFSIEPDAL